MRANPASTHPRPGKAESPGIGQMAILSRVAPHESRFWVVASRPGVLLAIAILGASVVLRFVIGASPLWIFFSSSLAILVLADWIRRATEQLARISGPAIGGLVNVTFGNAIELILGLFVLAAGHPVVVKAQITGS